MNTDPDKDRVPGEGSENLPEVPETPKEKTSMGRIFFKTADYGIEGAAAIIGTVFKVLGSLLLIFLITGLLFACVFAYYVKTCLVPDLDLSLEDYKLSESSTIYYQNSGGSWEELVTLAGQYKRKWVDYEDIPPYMEQALIAIEDKRFYEHKGVDWYRTSGAFVEMFAKMNSSFGGSTITQQLIKNLTGQDDVTISRKLTEIFGALELEKKYDKQEIMQWYLNAVYFGESCYGVQAAAETYFGKDVSELSLAECASIVGITNLPTYYDPFYSEENNKKRQETILREMYEQGFIDYDTYKDAAAEELVFTRSPDEAYAPEIYTYYEEVVISDVLDDLMELKGISRKAARMLLYNGGYKIYCCMDMNVQSTIDSVYTDLTAIPPASGSDQQFQSSIVIIDPHDGRILGLAGGVGIKDRNFPLNRATQTTRAPGSAFKPLASYGPAVNEGLITPDTLVNDSPNIRLDGTDWYPHNAGYEQLGVITIYTALQHSLNTVAAQIVDKLTPQTSYDYLTQRLGFEHLTPDDISYSPMALGQLTNGATVREMAQAYATFANDGNFTYSRTYSMVTDAKGNIIIDNQPKTIAAFDPNTAYVMTYMMQNAVENGTGKAARLWNMPVAGKTGTSGNTKDRWFCGVTPYYCAAVWTGYDTPATIRSNGNPAAQLFSKVMKPLHEGLEWRNFTPPYLGPNTGIFGLDEESEDYESDLIIDENGNIINHHPNDNSSGSGSGSIIIDGGNGGSNGHGGGESHGSDSGYEGNFDGGGSGGYNPGDSGGGNSGDDGGSDGIIIFG